MNYQSQEKSWRELKTISFNERSYSEKDTLDNLKHMSLWKGQNYGVYKIGEWLPEVSGNRDMNWWTWKSVGRKNGSASYCKGGCLPLTTCPD